MGLLLDGPKDPADWDYQDEVEYNHIKLRYSDRKALQEQAKQKHAALKDVVPKDPMYHRMAVSAEMASLRVDMAYILAENNKMREFVGSISWLHDQIGVLSGAYAHVKMLADKPRIDYAEHAKVLSEASKLIKELSNEIKQTSNGTDGPKS